MSDINLTKAVRQNLLTLQNTASMMAKTQNKLATGNKVNSALDNPSNYFTASSLNSRASDLGNLMDSMASGIKTIEAADNGLTSITKTLESMQSTLRQARQDKSFQTASYTLDDVTGNKSLTFTGGAFGKNGAGSVKLTTDSAKSATGTVTVSSLTSTFVEAKSKLAGADISADADTLKTTFGGKTLDITLGDTNDTITIAAGDLTDDAANTSLSSLADAINKQIDASTDLKGKVKASVSSDGKKVDLEEVSASDNKLSVKGTAFAITGAADATTAADGTQGSNGTSTFTVNGTTVKLGASDFANKATPTAAEAVKAINTQLANSNSKFEAVESSGKLKIQAKSTTAGDKLDIKGEGAKELFGAADATTSLTAVDDTSVNLAYSVDELVTMINDSKQSPVLAGKVKASNDNGKLRIQNLSTQDLDVSGVTTLGHVDGGAATQTIDGNSVRTGFADQFNELRDQLDKLADDASFNGINLLRGDKLSITFNENGTSAIDISAKDDKSVDSSTLGVPTTIKAEELDGDSTIDGFLSKVKSALDKVRAQSSAFGSNLSVVQNRQDFTTNMMNTLQTGAGNLTLADMNGEAANMVALQTRQSLATSSLSMANQSDQNVLQLLR